MISNAAAEDCQKPCSLAAGRIVEMAAGPRGAKCVLQNVLGIVRISQQPKGNAIKNGSVVTGPPVKLVVEFGRNRHATESPSPLWNSLPQGSLKLFRAVSLADSTPHRSQRFLYAQTPVYFPITGTGLTEREAAAEATNQFGNRPAAGILTTLADRTPSQASTAARASFDGS